MESPDRPTFYADRCLGKLVAFGLREAGALVEIHDDHFPQNAIDVDWIPLVARREWVILTKDKNIRRQKHEREAALLSRARIFTLPSGNWKTNEMVEVFTKHLEAMEALATGLKPPFLAVVSWDRIEIIHPRPTI